MERVASDVSHGALISVTVRTNTDDDAARELSVRPTQAIYESIASAFECEMRHVEQVEFGDEVVVEGATYEDYGVEVGCRGHFARLFVFGLVVVGGGVRDCAILIAVCGGRMAQG